MSGIMIDPEKLIEFFDRRQEETCGYGYDISTTDELRQFLCDFCHNEVDFGFGFICKKSEKSDGDSKRQFEVVDILGSKGLLCDKPGVLEGYCGQHECYIYYLTYNKIAEQENDPWVYILSCDPPIDDTYDTIMMKRQLSIEPNRPLLMTDEFFQFHCEVQRQTVDEFFGD